MAAPVHNGTRLSFTFVGANDGTLLSLQNGEGVLLNVRWYGTGTIDELKVGGTSGGVGGTACTLLGSPQTGGPSNGRSQWAVLPTWSGSSGNQNVWVDLSDGSSGGVEAWRISGHDTDTGVWVRNGASGSGTAVSVTLTSVQAECLGCAIGINDGGDWSSPGDSWSLLTISDVTWYDSGSQKADLGASGNKTVSATIASGTWQINAIAVPPASSATLDQGAFRFGADDGSESAHGWLAAQNTNLTRELGSAFLLRHLLQAAGDPASFAPTLRYAKNGGAYAVVPVGAGNAEAFSQPTWGAVGTAASGTTSCTPAYPTGIAAATSHLFCFITGRSNTEANEPTMPAGWTQVGTLVGGTGTWGVDTGTRRVTVFRKDTTTGSETGTVTVSLAGTTANTMRAGIHRFEVPSGYLCEIEFVTGADTSNDTSYSATASANATFDSDRLMVTVTAQNIDTGTATSRAVSASGITFGALTNRADTAVTNGNDHRHVINTIPVNSGSGTVAPTYTYTISANGSGPTGFLVMRGRLPAVNNEVYVVASANITDGEATTSRLTGGTGTFVAGKRYDTSNATGTVDPAADQHTEVEHSVTTQSPLTNGDYIDFRVYAGANPLDTYTQTARLTIGTPATPSLVPVQGLLARMPVLRMF